MLSQGASNPNEIVDSDVALSALNSADISGVKLGSFGQILLCPSVRNSQLANGFAYANSVRLLHPLIAWRKQTMSPETISIAEPDEPLAAIEKFLKSRVAVRT